MGIPTGIRKCTTDIKTEWWRLRVRQYGCGLRILSIVSPEAFSYVSKWIYSTNKCKIYATQMNLLYACGIAMLVETAKTNGIK